ncbi:hypothetical protein P4S63_01870 [Pseudoalteromonas sp. B193]
MERKLQDAMQSTQYQTKDQQRSNITKRKDTKEMESKDQPNAMQWQEMESIQQSIGYQTPVQSNLYKRFECNQQRNHTGSTKEM